MEPVEDVEQDHNGVGLESSVPSFNSSDYQRALSNPFEALLQSSSDDKVKTELSSILRFRGPFEDVVSRDQKLRVFNIGLPDLDPQIVFGNGTMTIEGPENFQNILENIWIGLISAGPYITTYTEPSELKELETKNGLGPSSLLSYRLYHTHIWMFHRDENRDYQTISDIEIKPMSPVMFASLTSKPKIVHFLMKYGTRFLDETRVQSADVDSVSMRMACMRALLSDIITELFENPEVWDSDALELKTDISSLPEGLRSKCLNFRLLLRCDPNPYVTTVKLATLIGPQLPPLPEMIVLRHIYDSLFPDLGLGLFNPPQLQHVCRCVIRRRLHENWQLPDGISQLELSKILCDYINLLDD